MNLKNITNFALLSAALVIAGTSCKKQDFSNTDPDTITSATVDYRTVLPASMTSTATIIEGANFKFLQNWMGYWARSGSYQDVTDEESYSFTNDFNVGVWNSLYTNATNYDFIVKNANEKGGGFYEAIARIMKSLDMQMLVDIYGNVPYSRAFEGADNRTPVYDKGRAIYDSLFLEIDKAIALLKDPIAIDPDKNGGIATNDLIYKGNANSWIKFANTIKLRMILHAFEVTDFDAAGKIAVIAAEGSGFINSGEGAELNPGYSDTKPQPYYRANVFTETGTAAANGAIERGNAYAVGPNPGGPAQGYYQWDGDFRTRFLYTAPGQDPGSTAPQRGIPYGEISGTNSDNTGDKLSTVDGLGYIPDGASSRAWILRDFESIFLQAEARERNILNSGPSAEELLNLGIHRSYAWLKAVIPPIRDVANTRDSVIFSTDSSANRYIAQNATYPDVDYNGVSQGPGLPAGGLFTILSQKWFALNGINTLEVWTDWRRTDVVYGEGGGFLPGPPISVNPARPASAGIPIRLFYPQNEYNYNSSNVLDQGTIDVTDNASPATGRIFWDIN